MDTHEVETQSSMKVQVEFELEGQLAKKHPRHG